MPGMLPVLKARSVTVIVEAENGEVRIIRSRYAAIDQDSGVEIKQDLTVTNQTINESSTEYQETHSIAWCEQWTEGVIR